MKIVNQALLLFFSMSTFFVNAAKIGVENLFGQDVYLQYTSHCAGQQYATGRVLVKNSETVWLDHYNCNIIDLETYSASTGGSRLDGDNGVLLWKQLDGTEHKKMDDKTISWDGWSFRLVKRPIQQ